MPGSGDHWCAVSFFKYCCLSFLTGDCQKNSPGHSAAYGTYTMRELSADHIIAQVIQGNLNWIIKPKLGFPEDVIVHDVIDVIGQK